MKKDCFNPPHYRTWLDVSLPRNFILLCDTKGEKGTCDDAFDFYRMGLIYDPASQDYSIFCVDRTSPLHGKRIQFYDPLPSRRLLVWRFRQTVVLYHLEIGADVPQLADIADYSENANSVARDGDIDTNTVDSSEDVGNSIIKSPLRAHQHNPT